MDAHFSSKDNLISINVIWIFVECFTRRFMLKSARFSSDHCHMKRHFKQHLKEIAREYYRYGFVVASAVRRIRRYHGRQTGKQRKGIIADCFSTSRQYRGVPCRDLTHCPALLTTAKFSDD